ncbi:MAG: NAD-dependent epimerase/dehydratase family protein [Cyanobacteria bacterium P01_G01_bin.54]
MKDILSKISKQKTWLITGGAGFIGSHIVSVLLEYNQKVVVFDNFEGDISFKVDQINNSNLKIYNGDICTFSLCQEAMRGVDLVLHHAALISVSGSMLEPMAYHRVNVQGFWNVLESSRLAGVERVVYASSSAVYGDCLQKEMSDSYQPQPISVYAGTKYINELQANTYYKCYGLETIGLRYFNIYGSRQNPTGAYASVIPKWISRILDNQPCIVYGDGRNTRDFCHVSDVVTANLLAATTSNSKIIGSACNIGTGTYLSLNTLLRFLQDCASQRILSPIQVKYEPAREGDIIHSVANIERAKKLLGYHPKTDLRTGLSETLDWFIQRRGEAL